MTVHLLAHPFPGRLTSLINVPERWRKAWREPLSETVVEKHLLKFVLLPGPLSAIEGLCSNSRLSSITFLRFVGNRRGLARKSKSAEGAAKVFEDPTWPVREAWAVTKDYLHTRH